MGNIKKEGNTIDDEFVGKNYKSSALAGAVRGLFSNRTFNTREDDFCNFNKKLDIGEKQISKANIILLGKHGKQNYTKYEGRYTENKISTLQD